MIREFPEGVVPEVAKGVAEDHQRRNLLPVGRLQLGVAVKNLREMER